MKKIIDAVGVMKRNSKKHLKEVDKVKKEKDIKKHLLKEIHSYSVRRNSSK